MMRLVENNMVNHMEALANIPAMHVGLRCENQKLPWKGIEPLIKWVTPLNCFKAMVPYHNPYNIPQHTTPYHHHSPRLTYQLYTCILNESIILAIPIDNLHPANVRWHLQKKNTRRKIIVCTSKPCNPSDPQLIPEQVLDER